MEWHVFVGGAAVVVIVRDGTRENDECKPFGSSSKLAEFLFETCVSFDSSETFTHSS